MSNLLDKASIILTPTAYNNGEALCVKPSDGSGDFDFSRNSAATRVNAQGLVENVQILSSNLVQNGDFSEEGVQEVSNGSFSQEGSELITNGDFATDSDWTLGTGWTISGGTANYDGLQAYQLLRQGTANGVIGKTYLVKYDVSNNNGTGGIIAKFGGVNLSSYNSDNGSFEFYVEAISTDYIRFTPQIDFNGSIDNVSVREVGQDWTFTNWSLTTGNVLLADTGGYVYQSNVFEVGKSYKVSVNVKDYTSGNLRIDSNGANNWTPSGSNSVATIYISNLDKTYLLLEGTFRGSITNISVKEVGQNWDLGTGWSIGNNVAISDGVSSNSNLVTTSAIFSGSIQVKVTLSVTNYVSGTLRPYLTSGFFTEINANGDYTFYTTADRPDGKLYLKSLNFNGSITNISVLEITDDTNLPRINYEGFSYQDVLGSELVVNGDFATDSNWNKDANWSIANGVATSTGFGRMFQSIPFLETNVGTKVKVSFDITEKTNGGVVVNCYGGVSQLFTSVGTHTFVTTTINSTNLYFNNVGAGGGFTGSIDNVSVKEYLGQSVVPGSGCGSWLFEPQSTNTVTDSEDYSQWTPTGVSVTSNSTTSPDGLINGTLLSTNGGTSIRLLRNYGLPTSATIKVLSIYAKANLSNFIQLPLSGDAQSYVNFDVLNGVVGTSGTKTTGEIQSVGNGWYRCIAYFDSTTVFGASSFVALVTSNSVGYGGVANSDDLNVYIWGSQYEEQSYATSYIPTSGSTVTRNQDVCTNGGSLASINSTEGTLYAEIAALANDGTTRAIYISNGTTSNRLWIEFDAAANRFEARYIANGTTSANFFHTVPDITDFNKIAFKWKENDFSLYVNGLEVGNDTSGSAISADTLNRIDFHNQASSSVQNLFGKTKALAVWKTALSDQELADLTYPTPTFPTFSLDFDTIATDFTFARGSEATYVDAQGLIQSTNEIGEELVVNGSFDSDTAWNLGTGVIIANSKLTKNNPSVGNTSASQGAVFTVGKTYKYKLVVSGNLTASDKVVGFFTDFTSAGTYEGYFTANATSLVFSLRGSTNVYSIDSVSVKEYTTATNTPRLDYSTGAEAFLLEPQSTNLIPYSSDFSQWTLSSNASVNANQTISPDGTQNAYLLNSTQASSRVQVNLGNLTGVYAQSIYLKYAGDDVLVRIRRNQSNDRFDLIVNSDGITAGAVESGVIEYSIEAVGNDWYRVWNTQNNLTWYQIYIDANGNGGSIYAYGAQLEALPYASSLIPTSGSQVTRNQETCINATPEINSEEGVLYFEGSALSDGFGGAISLSDGTSSNYIYLYYHPSGTKIVAKIVVNSITVYDKNITTLDEVNYNKIAFKYQDSSFKIFANGVNISSLNQNSGNTFPINILNKLSFDNGAGSTPFFGNTKDLQVYTKALSDAELIKLTTI